MDFENVYIQANGKELSCGFLLFEASSGKLLACHSTGKKFEKGTYDIPKGHIKEGETPLQCACRELEEETGIKLDINNIDGFQDLGQHEYVKTKDLHLFRASIDFDISELKCTTYFEAHGRKFPEVNQFKLIDIDELDYYFPSLRKLINKVL